MSSQSQCVYKKTLIKEIHQMNINERTQFLINTFTDKKPLKYYVYKKVKLLHQMLVFYHSRT